MVKKNIYYLALSLLFVVGHAATSFANGQVSHKPRIINTTDLGADPDDQQSMVRFLVCANEFDTEGLIVATGCWKTSQNSTGMLDKIVNAYEKVYANLIVHADGYPTPEYLKSISVLGQRDYGMGGIGADKDSPGSELIIASVDRDDPRPVWVMGWGGVNNVAQAIWKVQNTRTPEELAQFISKLRVFDILGQDDAGAWLTKNFPDLFYIRATGVYGWAPSDSWIDEKVQDHGPLGAEYPDRQWATEGDTPSFMHVYPTGLNDPDQINQGGWGGRFSFTKKANIRGMSKVNEISNESQYDPYYMYTNTSDGAGAISRWKPSYDNDFEARMDWSITNDYSSVNHHPVAVVNGDTSRKVLKVSAEPGTTVNLSAVGSSDPDGHALFYKWTFYRDPGTYKKSVTIDNATTETPTVHVPSDAGGSELHIILELRDAGEPRLYAYRRVIIQVSENSGIDESRLEIFPKTFRLFQNYPNPFNPETAIKYELANDSFVTLKIYNIYGQDIDTIVSTYQAAGEYEIAWQPDNFPSGHYFCRLQADDFDTPDAYAEAAHQFSETRKLILLK